MDPNKLNLRLDDISEVNPALTCYHRDDPAPVLPLREEPDLLSWLENTGRLVAEKDGDSQEILFEGVSLDCRHPGPRRMLQGVSDQHSVDHFIGESGECGESGQLPKV